MPSANGMPRLDRRETPGDKKRESLEIAGEGPRRRRFDAAAGPPAGETPGDKKRGFWRIPVRGIGAASVVRDHRTRHGRAAAQQPHQQPVAVGRAIAEPLAAKRRHLDTAHRRGAHCRRMQAGARGYCRIPGRGEAGHRAAPFVGQRAVDAGGPGCARYWTSRLQGSEERGAPVKAVRRGWIHRRLQSTPRDAKSVYYLRYGKSS
jgi:hypothetical protein